MNNLLNIELSNAKMKNLSHFLQLMTVDSLKYLIAFLPVDKKPTRKGELVNLVQQSMLGDNLKRLWEQLDEIQKSAVSETVHTYGGVFSHSRFSAKYGTLPSFISSKKSRYSYGEQPGILRLFMYNEGRYGGKTFVIPKDILNKLRAFVATPIPSSLPSIDTLPEFAGEYELTRFDTETFAQMDLLAILGLINQGKLSVSSKTFLPSKVSMSKIAEVLGGGDYYSATEADSFGDTIKPIKGFAWPLLIQAANLAELSGSKLKLTNLGKKALSVTPADTIKLIWQRWLVTELIDEFNRIDEVKGQKRKSRDTLTEAASRRAIIANALSQCSVGSWVELSKFSRFMQSENYFFEITENPWDLYICDPEYGSLGYEGYHDWKILQARYIACLLFEYAATLGLIDVAYVHPENVESDFHELWGTDDLLYLSRYDGLLYFRITALGAYCFGLTKTYDQKKTDTNVKLSVLPNLHVKVFGELPFDKAQILSVYTDKISDHQWRFNPDKMIEAIEHGYDIADLERFLIDADDQLLPESVESLIKRVERQAKSLQVKGSKVLIECIDEETAKKVAEHEYTKKHCMLAGNKHLVLTGTEKTFRKALRKLGYGMPMV